MKFTSTLFSLFSKKQEYLFLFIIFFSILSNLLQIFGLTSIIPLITILASEEKILEIDFFNKIYIYFNIESIKDFKYFLFYVSIFGISISTFFSLCSMYLNSYFSNKFSESLERKIFKYYIQEEYVYFSKNNISQIISKITNEIPRIKQNIVSNSVGLIINTSMLIFLTISILFVDFFVSIIAISSLGIFYGLFFFNIKRIATRQGENISNLQYKKTKSILDSLNNIKYLKFINDEKFYINIHRFSSNKLAKIFINNSIIINFPRVVMEFTLFLGTVLICLYFSNIYGSFSEFLPMLTIFAIASIKALPAINQIFTAIISLKSNISALYSFEEEYLNMKKSEIVSSDEELIFKENIKLENVSFKYPSGNFKIDNLNLEIKKNNFVGFCGTTGSGKTTLIDILSGLISPNQGNLSIDSIPLKKNQLTNYRKIIGYVPQEIFLGNLTIKESIALGYNTDNINQKTVEESCKLADIHEFIVTLKDGYETMVGDNGIKLSGGQKQRIGIARALYKKPKILIFDEATSSLDYHTENKIIETVTSFKGKITLIMITHRLETIKNCDTIFEVSDGKLLKQKRFEDLKLN